MAPRLVLNSELKWPFDLSLGCWYFSQVPPALELEYFLLDFSFFLIRVFPHVKFTVFNPSMTFDINEIANCVCVCVYKILSHSWFCFDFRKYCHNDFIWSSSPPTRVPVCWLSPILRTCKCPNRNVTGMIATSTSSLQQSSQPHFISSPWDYLSKLVFAQARQAPLSAHITFFETLQSSQAWTEEALKAKRNLLMEPRK